MKKILLLIPFLIFGGIIYVSNVSLPTATGYVSKYLCSQVFLAERDSQFVFENDIKNTNFFFNVVKHSIDQSQKTVTASGFGFWKPMSAKYREGLGCTLVINTSHEELLAQTQGTTPQKKPDFNSPWPLGEKVDQIPIPANIDQEKLNQAIEQAFQEPAENSAKNTHAVVIVYKNQLIAERYHEQFTPQTPILGWSMAKTVTGVLIGILSQEGKLEINDPAPISAWKKEQDPRAKITIDQLLRMSSGLEFDEVYMPATDATTMLYERKSAADFAIAKPLAYEPGAVFQYSSGTTNILARIMKESTGGTLVSSNNFVRRKLFDRIGMRTAIMEADSSGSFVGSSYMFASARDWARIGMLMEQDGIWNEERILPEGWVKYMTTPTPSAKRGNYGAQTWLNVGKNDKRPFLSLPTEMFYFSGFNGQTIAIFPSRDLVVVRMGATSNGEWGKVNFLEKVLNAIPATNLPTNASASL